MGRHYFERYSIQYCMKNFLRKIRIPIFCCLLAIIVVFSVVFAYPALNAQSRHEPAAPKEILRLWHIDSFEGGIGSRADFLSSAAKEYEKKYGRYVLVTVHSSDSAQRAISEGSIPDMISFGTYFGAAAEIVLPLEKYSFPAASMNGQTYAVPWCRGNYFLFGKDGDFSHASAGNTVISSGGTALAEAAAYEYGLSGEISVLPSVRAYVDFINGKYEFMIGTQRDVSRFRTRNFNVEAVAIQEFCDLWQYIGVCSADAETYAACMDFLYCLLSEETQKKLTKIGMLSAFCDVYGSSEKVMDGAEKGEVRHTVSAWLSEEKQQELRRCASAALKGDKNGAKNFENFLQ